ncbi:Type ISP restriction-modification enzyme, C-terminal specificity domain-containing protein [[Mycoplasma] cavipharyngis]|uniref:type ISP restriction/modification enzyme n=1 Tax=[Mycoplasma] cavipharyngis TaxID=92757 RepID=UPI00370392F1
MPDNFKTTKKLNELKNNNSLYDLKFEKIIPDKNNDWLNQINPKSFQMIKLAYEKNKSKNDQSSIFDNNYSSGINTAKNKWVYSFDKQLLIERMTKYIEEFNELSNDLQKDLKLKSLTNIKNQKKYIMEYIHKNSNSKIKISELQSLLTLRNKLIDHQESEIRVCCYKPFVKRYLYFNKNIFHSLHLSLNMFPKFDTKNILICTSALKGGSGKFFYFVTNELIDAAFYSSVLSQCYPLYWYQKNKEPNLFENDSDIKNYAINSESVNSFQKKYNDLNITAFHIYIYIYALFHHSTYNEKYRNNLMKEPPWIPYLKDFWKYVDIGEKLINLHVNYEKVPPYQNVKIEIVKEDYKIKKINFEDNKQTIKFNEYIAIKNIPLKAYEYKVGDRSPLEWVKNEYRYSIDYESQIINDPNKFDEIKGGKYVFDLILSLITLSLETLDLIDQLPEYQEI